MIKVALVGASSFLGRSIYESLTREFAITGTYFQNTLPFARIKLDITNPEEVDSFLADGAFDYVIWCAGLKDVARCEKDPRLAQSLNAEPIKHLVESVQKHRLPTKTIFISTDYVFDGARGGYTTSSAPNPGTEYGKSKLLAESYLKQSSLPYKIVRTAAIMGVGGNFFDWLISSLCSEETVGLLADSYFSPTPVGLFADVLAQIILNFDKIEEQVIHLVGEKRLSRYEFALVLKGMAETFTATVQSENRPAGASFMPDTSLVPSAITIKSQKMSYHEYIGLEVKKSLHTASHAGE